jgi:hypothetical protein
MTTLIQKYKCDFCGKIYSQLSDADDCCLKTLEILNAKDLNIIFTTRYDDGEMEIIFNYNLEIKFNNVDVKLNIDDFMNYLEITNVKTKNKKIDEFFENYHTVIVDYISEFRKEYFQNFKKANIKQNRT